LKNLIFRRQKEEYFNYGYFKGEDEKQSYPDEALPTAD